MDTVIMPKADWTAALDATRKKGGTTALLKSGELAQAIRDIPTGGPATVIQPLTVTENGDYTAPPGVDGYSPVSVNVPTGGDAEAIAVRILSHTVQDLTLNTLKIWESERTFRQDLTIKSISTPNLEEILAGSVFESASNLTSVNMPKLNYIKLAANFKATGLVTAIFPALNSMPFNDSFSNMVNLIKFDAGRDAVEGMTIGQRSFQNCPKLITVIFRHPKVSDLKNTNVFEGTPIASGTGFIYVPKALLEQYKAATNWVTYAAQIRAIEDYPDITGG